MLSSFTNAKSGWQKKMKWKSTYIKREVSLNWEKSKQQISESRKNHRIHETCEFLSVLSHWVYCKTHVMLTRTLKVSEDVAPLGSHEDLFNSRNEESAVLLAFGGSWFNIWTGAHVMPSPLPQNKKDWTPLNHLCFSFHYWQEWISSE